MRLNHLNEAESTHHDSRKRANRTARYSAALLSAIIASTVAAEEQPTTEIPPSVALPTPAVAVAVQGEAQPAVVNQLVVTANQRMLQRFQLLHPPEAQ